MSSDPRSISIQAWSRWTIHHDEAMLKFYDALRRYSRLTTTLTGKPMTTEQEVRFYEEYVREHGGPIL